MGPTEWISKWRGYEILKSIAGHHVGRQVTFLNSRRSRMTKTVIFWTLVSLLIVSALKLSFFLCFLFFFCYTKGGGEGTGAWPPAPWCRQPCNIIIEICKPLIWISNSELIYSLQKKNISWAITGNAYSFSM